MVSVGKLKAGQARYYLDQAEPHPSQAAALASGAEDYYVGGTEAAGRWLGRGAPSLALRTRSWRRQADGASSPAWIRERDRSSGAADRSRASTSRSRRPRAQRALRHRRRARPVDDPRSARASRDRRLRLLRGRALGRPARRRRSPRIAGNGLTAAAFLHRTSRAGDPQLHTHVARRQPHPGFRRPVVGARRAARLRACANGGLPLPSRAACRARARAWAFDGGRCEKGMAEIDGVPARGAASVLAASGRDRGGDGAARLIRPGRGADRGPCHPAGQGSRRPMPEQLVPEWRERATRRGLDAARIARIFSRGRVRRGARLGRGVSRAWPARTASRATARRFGRRDVMQALSSAAGAGRAGQRDHRPSADVFLARPERGALLDAHASDVEARYSTPELLEIESAASWTARIALQSVRPRARERGRDRAPLIGATLPRPTSNARWCAGSHRTATGCRGRRAARAPARRPASPPHETLGGSRACRSAAVRSRARPRASSSSGRPAVDERRRVLHERRPLAPGTVLIVDEAGMLGTRDLDQLLARVKARGRQARARRRHPPAPVDPRRRRPRRSERRGSTRSSCERTDASARPGNATPWSCSATGDENARSTLYERQGRLRTGRHDDEVLPQLIADWHAYGDPDGSVMIAHRRADVAELNARARALMRADGPARRRGS